MSDNDGVQVLPVLKSGDWPGLAHGARAHVWLGTPQDPRVVVAYAWAKASGLSYVTTSNDPYDTDDDLVRTAFENLEYYHTDFEVVEADGGRILVSAGWPFATERVLCQSHMLRAHEKLDADEILVSIPRRGAMLACAKGCADEVMATMAGLHNEAWRNDESGTDRVVDELIVVRAGLMVSTLPALSS